MLLEHWQGWWCDHFPENLLQWLATLSVKKQTVSHTDGEFQTSVIVQVLFIFFVHLKHFEIPVGKGKLFENSQQNYFDFSFGYLPSLMIQSIIWNISILVIIFLKHYLRMVEFEKDCFGKIIYCTFYLLKKMLIVILKQTKPLFFFQLLSCCMIEKISAE